LQPAFGGEVDLVVHGGDVFDHPYVGSAIGYQALEPLRRIAERGIPVAIVPGNHERSRVPHLRFATHPNVHVFDRPRTFAIDVKGVPVTLAGFPYERRNVRQHFRALVESTSWEREPDSVRLLCVHHCIEGATVGPQNFRFTTARDVIRINDVPPEFAAVFSGHIHRHQVLTRDLRGRRVAVPVMYPGSIERTAYAEMSEEKGYLIVEIDANTNVRWRFERLPTDPMTPPIRDERRAAAIAGNRRRHRSPAVPTDRGPLVLDI
jgi:DNA repair exonuclease SbcCD nuclease subunit